MQVAIDKFGRMVLPKEIRDDFDLVPGSILDVEEESETIVLKPQRSDGVVNEERGVWVYEGNVDTDTKSTLRQLRDERLDRLG